MKTKNQTLCVLFNILLFIMCFFQSTAQIETDLTLNQLKHFNQKKLNLVTSQNVTGEIIGSKYYASSWEDWYVTQRGEYLPEVDFYRITKNTDLMDEILERNKKNLKKKKNGSIKALLGLGVFIAGTAVGLSADVDDDAIYYAGLGGILVGGGFMLGGIFKWRNAKETINSNLKPTGFAQGLVDEYNLELYQKLKNNSLN